MSNGQWAVVATTEDGNVYVYGPYRSEDRAQAVARRLEDDYEVSVTPLLAA